MAVVFQARPTYRSTVIPDNVTELELDHFIRFRVATSSEWSVARRNLVERREGNVGFLLKVSKEGF
jgi:uncharacterized protein YfiM (DUF2279 family)